VEADAKDLLDFLGELGSGARRLRTPQKGEELDGQLEGATPAAAFVD
jgi:hypothetical protein